MRSATRPRPRVAPAAAGACPPSERDPAAVPADDEAAIRASQAKRKAAAKRRALQPSEAQVVVAIRNRLLLHGVLCQVNSNEAMSRVLGYSRQIAGTIPGFPDLTVIGNGIVGFLEVKAPGVKVNSEAKRRHEERQQHAREMIERRGCRVAKVDSQDAAVAVLREWGMLK